MMFGIYLIWTIFNKYFVILDVSKIKLVELEGYLIIFLILKTYKLKNIVKSFSKSTLKNSLIIHIKYKDT